MKKSLVALVLQHSKTFSLHTVTGVLSVVVHYSVMWLLGYVGALPVTASMTGFFAGAFVKFMLSYQHVFPTNQKWHQSAPKFALAIGIQALLNWAFLRIGLCLGMSVWIAQILTTGTLVALNYVMYRYWVFAFNSTSGESVDT